jgi:indolepyruvate ferredoxin oxidoreductase, beta subunit
MLSRDPLNLIITGVGGQGNILISKLIGEILIDDGWYVTIGETYGASQRGGSVASHVRVSGEMTYGPLTPSGQADVILGLEPVETLRILSFYGSPDTFVITNTRPVHPMAVAVGDAEYPDLEIIKEAMARLCRGALYIDASKIAIELGAPLLANLVMCGGLVGSGLLPLTGIKFEKKLRRLFQGTRRSAGLKAFKSGIALVPPLALSR